jgi:hypothetical protein
LAEQQHPNQLKQLSQQQQQQVDLVSVPQQQKIPPQQLLSQQQPPPLQNLGFRLETLIRLPPKHLRLLTLRLPSQISPLVQKMLPPTNLK